MTKEAQRADLHKTIWRIANDLRSSVAALGGQPQCFERQNEKTVDSAAAPPGHSSSALGGTWSDMWPAHGVAVSRRGVCCLITGTRTPAAVGTPLTDLPAVVE